VLTINDSTSSTVALPSSPNARGQPAITETSDSTGIVSAVEASAEPSARLRLLCSRFASAQRGRRLRQQHDRRNQHADCRLGRSRRDDDPLERWGDRVREQHDRTQGDE
jgi:hypothetical protein